MTIPATFDAFRIHSDHAGYRSGIERVSLDDLAPGEIVVRVAHSSVNFKDALAGTGETGVLTADQIFKAIGQTFEAAGLGSLAMAGGRIAVDSDGRTSMPTVWAGGDCVRAGEDLTVTSVAQGRDAAVSINRMLAAGAQPASAVA